MSEIDAFHKAFRGNFSSLLKDNSSMNSEMSCAVTPAPADISTRLVPRSPRISPPPRTSTDSSPKIDKLLHRERHEDYCGIVYTDSMEAPALIKIFEPSNLGVSCGFSNNPPLPGWVVSLIPPQPIESQRPLPASRQRWWQALWT